MSIGGYKIRSKYQVHFLTFAVVEWIDVFTRQQYRDILLDSIKFCQLQKGLLLNAWCIMSNHVHLMAASKEGKLSEIMRDFKKYTSTQLIKAIETNDHESRKAWMLPLFKAQGFQNSRNLNVQFWRQDNHPVELYSPKMTLQKLSYIHDNPVRAGIVEKPEDYLYSSARDYKEGRKIGLLDVIFI